MIDDKQKKNNNKKLNTDNSNTVNATNEEWRTDDIDFTSPLWMDIDEDDEYDEDLADLLSSY